MDTSDVTETKAQLIRWVVGVGILQLTIITALLLKLANHFGAGTRLKSPFLEVIV